MRIYGNGGVPAAWIINLVDRQVEVFSDPCPEGYRARQVFDASQEVPLLVDGEMLGRIAVDELLPQKA